MKLRYLIVFLTILTPSIYAQDISIIPAPVQIQRGDGFFTLSNSTNIIMPANQPEINKVASYLVNKVKPATGFSLKTTTSGQGIQFVLNGKPDVVIGKEGYNLTVAANNVLIKANSPAGLFYGVQSLIQLLPPAIESNSLQQATWQIPVVTITDFPRFAWRGIMLDVSRHFFTKEYVKAYIDQIARYKFNILHWHLTDDNGWRLEIKSLPKLTEVGSLRVPRTGTFGSNEAPKPGEAATDGGFYTQDDIKEIVQYALDRQIQVLPEIDIPGHSMAAIAAYPELSVTKDVNTKVNPGSKFSTWFGAGKFEMSIDNTLNPTDENVYQFLDKVFTEVATLFPFEYIHLGGDECYKGFWERDPGVQAFMKKNKIANGEELQSYFVKRVSKIIIDKKKKPIGWDEILEGGLAPGTAVMSWRGTKGGIEASHQKARVVMSPAPIYYLDMRQGEPSIEPPVYSDARLKDVYAFDILPKEIDSTYVLGGQANLWTEQIATTAHAEYMTYPRAFAVSETLWTPKAKKDWNGFATRVENHFTRFDQGHSNYARSVYDPIIKVTKNTDGALVIDLSTELQGLDVYWTMDNSIPNQYASKYSSPIVFTPDVDMLRVVTYRNGQQVGRLLSVKTEDLVKRVKK